mmetsp:Transcript_18675/g.30963  ORF Transcript_18675/g.30963 Transcript_18675/m.30963 type:complete len:90 (-) Transcript_18675:111-380(-)|eukprot:CAMPEP_0119009888 /NCGR_PEP_ID=MMETSP1176-20130426/4661_1 /TAXON_ID=265551 /ORGANISM="Synedropsis recta cf, Strain CCMP1620" /LENGTH=89 /DNA_ID=CAMNT_0006962471 /DNA_START=400 /DNA_END=669 /DNA_ORIENTATION=+
MGNDLSSQASMLAAKKKMSGALSSVEDQLSLKNHTNKSADVKTKQKDWNNMHNETKEIHQHTQTMQKERVMSAKEKWEANRKKKEQMGK